MIRTSFALLLTAALAFGITGCRADRPVQHSGGGGSLMPAPDPSFGGGHVDGPPMLPPAASLGQRLRANTVSSRLPANPFRRASRTKVSSPGLLPTPDTGMPEAVSAPTLW
ncbi:MAG: hypothetical protein AB8G99_22465 [Planctomycetaceae bacterium]